MTSFYEKAAHLAALVEDARNASGHSRTTEFAALTEMINTLRLEGATNSDVEPLVSLMRASVVQFEPVRHKSAAVLSRSPGGLK